MPAVSRSEHRSAVRRLPEAYPQALLLLLTPMLAQLSHKMPWQRDRPAPVLGALHRGVFTVYGSARMLRCNTAGSGGMVWHGGLNCTMGAAFVDSPSSIARAAH